jgi:para-aminobenzoate synthetase/4-amino-4-deoxychorismate lyase
MKARIQAQTDPELGVFETLLVLDGTAVELDAHLDRLAASVRSLYGAALPTRARHLLEERAGGLDLGRVRLTIAPGSSGLECEVAAEAIDPEPCFPSWEAGAELRGFRLPGGLGAHKWADRSPIPRFADGAVPLLLSEDGDVLEAGTANVFAVLDEALITPAADGRILPGITRAVTITAAQGQGLDVHQRRVAYEELLGAREVFLTGSVRGIVPARALDGTALGGGGEVSSRVAEALRESWQGGRGSTLAPTPAGAPGLDRRAR